jgi:hypothetical protein
VISEGLVAKMATFFDQEAMALLLNRWGDKVKITEEVAKAAAGNGRKGREIMTLLLDRYGDELKITEEVLKAAADNKSQGKEIMQLLPRKGGASIEAYLPQFERFGSGFKRYYAWGEWQYMKGK